LEVKIAGLAALGRRATVADQPQPSAGVHAGWHLHLQLLAAARADGSPRAERRLGEADLEPPHQVVAPGRPGAHPGAAEGVGPHLPAEQAGEDVSEVAEVARDMHVA